MVGDDEALIGEPRLGQGRENGRPMRRRDFEQAGDEVRRRGQRRHQKTLPADIFVRRVV